MNNNSNASYLKRERKRKLSRFTEYKSATFATGITFAIFLVIFFGAFDFATQSFNMGTVSASLIYLVSTVIQALLTFKIKSDILKKGEVSSATRKLGFIMLLFVLTANIFIAIAAFNLIKKDKGIEYNLAIYSVLTSFTVMMISLLNLFKEYVANTFMLGMGVLAGLTIFYAVVMLLIHKFVHGKNVDKHMKPIGYLLIVSAISGNVFALLLGLVIITKIKHAGDEISVEWIEVLRRLFRNNMAIIGMFVVTVLLSSSLCSYLTFDYSIATDNNYSALLLEPSLEYPFGTDDYGRCVFTRIVFGARISLAVGIATTVVPIIIGGVLGAISGFYGGKSDNIIMRLLDVLYAVPGILLAIAIVAAFGTSTFNLIMALSIGSIPTYARTVRASVLGLANSEFVEAAKACGAKDHIIIFKHIIPNSMAPIIVRATLSIGGAVLSTSSLSYLGLGVEPHVPEWGNILKAGSTYLETNPYLAIYPGLAIILLVLAFNYMGDGLRDALDPKLK